MVNMIVGFSGKITNELSHRRQIYNKNYFNAFSFITYKLQYERFSFLI